MSVFKLETEEVARELRVVVQDSKEFDSRNGDLPLGVHVVDMPSNKLVVLSNKNAYRRHALNEDIWLPLLYDIRHLKTRVGKVSKVVPYGSRSMILLEDQRTLLGDTHEKNDEDGVFNARDPVVDIARSDARSYVWAKYYPMLTNVPHTFLPSDVKINDISWLYFARCAALSNGTILVWGRVNFQISDRGLHEPFPSGGLKLLSVPGMRPGGKIVSLASGFEHIVWVVKHEGEVGGRVCVYGSNGSNQCGVARIRFCEPMEIRSVPGLSGMVKSVGCGSRASFALTVSGRIFVWGDGGGGVLGVITPPAREILPTEIFPPKEGTIWLKMACGQSSIALYGNTENRIQGAATWGQHGGTGRLVSSRTTAPRDIAHQPELMELLRFEDPGFVNLNNSGHLGGRESFFTHIIFTRDDFGFQEFGVEDVEERFDFGDESGMYKQVRRRRRW